MAKKSLKKSKSKTLTALHKAKELTLDMNDALRNNDLVRFSEIINKSWEAKRKYTRGITNPRIEMISKKAFANGAIALKVTGAGGGGHMYIYAKPSKQSGIIKSLKNLGVKNVIFNYKDTGASVFNINNL